MSGTELKTYKWLFFSCNMGLLGFSRNNCSSFFCHKLGCFKRKTPEEFQERDERASVQAASSMDLTPAIKGGTASQSQTNGKPDRSNRRRLLSPFTFTDCFGCSTHMSTHTHTSTHTHVDTHLSSLHPPPPSFCVSPLKAWQRTSNAPSKGLQLTAASAAHESRRCVWRCHMCVLENTQLDGQTDCVRLT